MAGTRNYDFLVSFNQFEYTTVVIARITVDTDALDQATLDRRLWSREIMLPATLQRRLLHSVLYHDDRYRLQDTHKRARR